MNLKRILSDAEIDQIIKNTNATMAIESFEPADFANEVFRKYAKGSITEEQALELIKKYIEKGELPDGKQE